MIELINLLIKTMFLEIRFESIQSQSI